MALVPLFQRRARITGSRSLTPGTFERNKLTGGLAAVVSPEPGPAQGPSGSGSHRSSHRGQSNARYFIAVRIYPGYETGINRPSRRRRRKICKDAFVEKRAEVKTITGGGQTGI